MAGIILWLILGAWFFICIKLSQLLVKRIDNQRIKVLSKWLLFAIFLTAPVMDEIIGGFQFRELCSSEDMLVYDEEKIKNNVLILTPISNTVSNDYLLPIRLIRMGGREASSSELIIEYKKYKASGGWLSRRVSYNGISKPYTFDGVCGVKKELEVLKSMLKVEFEYK